MNKWKELKEKYGFTYKQLEKLTGIPKRTYQGWVYSETKGPEYVYALLSYYLAHNFKQL